MAQEYRTGVVLSDEAVEWTTARAARGGAVRVGSGICDLRVPAQEAQEEEGAAERIAAERIRDELARVKCPVALGLPASQVLLRVVTLPSADAAELAGMVELQIDKLSPFPVESLVVSYEVLRQDENSSLVLIAGARQDVVEQTAERLRAGRPDLRRVDANAMAWWRLLADGKHILQQGRHAVILFERAVPYLLVFQDGVPIVFRTVRLAAGRGPEQDAADLVREVNLTRMALEIEHGNLALGSIQVWHAGAKPDALVEALRARFGCVVNPSSLDDLPPVSEGIVRRALDGRPGILDLTPLAWRQALKARTFRRRMLAVAVTLVGLWGVAAMGVYGGLRYEESRLAALRAERERWRQPALDVRTLRRRVFMIERYNDFSRSSLECLREICLLQPAGVELTSFTYRKDDSVKLSGRAANVGQVYDFKSKLDASALFGETTLTGPTLDRRTNEQIFGIDIQLPGGEK